MKHVAPMLAVLALMLGGVGQAKATTIFDTTPSWNGSNALDAWGPGSTATFGETFIVPTTDNVLQNFTFYLKGDGGIQPTVTFQADVYAWSGLLQGGHSPQGSTGTPLFSESGLTFTDNGTFQAVTVNTGGTALSPGGQYVALFTASDPTSLAANRSGGEFLWGDISGTARPGSHVANDGSGGLNFYNNASSAQLSTPPWDDFADFGDSAWKATFTSPNIATPEPASLTLLGGLGLSLLGYGWRRRRQSA